MAGSTLQKDLREGRLRLLLAAFFVALAVPTLVLIYQAYAQLKWEAFHQHRQMAEELAARVDARLTAWFAAEEARSFADYNFLVVAGDPKANFLQRSPLAQFPVEAAVPGLVGYFQVDAEGRFSTPLLPAAGGAPDAYGITPPEYAARIALERRIQQVLSENRLVRERDAAERFFAVAAPSRPGPGEDEAASAEDAPEEAGKRTALAPPDSAAQQVFERLEAAEQNVPAGVLRSGELDRLEDLELDSAFEAKSRSAERLDSQAARAAPSPSTLPRRESRKEQIALPEAEIVSEGTASGATELELRSDVRISTFESEIDPFEFSLLDQAHFVLFRKVWRDDQRYIQGAVIERRGFLGGAIESAFRDTVLSQMSELIVGYRGEVLDAYSGSGEREYLPGGGSLSGALLYRAHLSAPLDGLELLFTITRLPAPPGGTLITWVAVILVLVLCGGFLVTYRFGLGQIRLARQQQDFVSAVSHELRTPLTSIRMYGEMLREGWVDEHKRKTYYDFIYDESERLSRLISNVLQLARMTRNDPQFDPKEVTVRELMDLVRSKVASQVERAGFRCELSTDPAAADAILRLDTDCFAQIVINLVDNAVKFSAHAPHKRIEIASRLQKHGGVLFTVRDYGPGVPKGQMKKIFRLFYRPEGELTRETVGTGIGLALVHQLTLAMGGQVDVRNCEPGAQFRVSFPLRAPKR